jgi:hypothetical protein
MGTGGGGATQTGGNSPSPTQAGTGGNGAPNDISGSAVDYAGGGGGGAYGGTFGPGGTGGGGRGGQLSSPQTPGVAGTANTGGGGGGGGCNVSPGGAGGSGVVIIRYPSAVAGVISLAPGTNVKTTAPNGDGIATFTVSGTLTVASSQ